LSSTTGSMIAGAIISYQRLKSKTVKMDEEMQQK
jgi:hypothetical protein